MDKNEVKKIKESLEYKKKSVGEAGGERAVAAAFKYADGYMKFLDAAKTEREAVAEAIRTAVSFGYKEYRLGDKIKKGGKYYFNNRGKSMCVFSVGDKGLDGGLRILAAHIDSPRIDLKQRPLYEDGGMSFFKTHYYGGLRKYQWTAIPLSLHGVVAKKDGSTVNIIVGESDGDPIFTINDLLPHLAREQSKKPLSEAIPGETLNIVVGGLPLGNEDGGIKLNVLKILNDKYGITEDDFASAELCAVPAFKARDIGFDRALIGAYGHDDRVCAYPALTAALEAGKSGKYSVLCILADKEETGSDGVSGMKSRVFSDLLEEIALSLGENPRVMRANAKALSADVTAAFDPNFAEVYEKKNSALVSCGVAISKYTGGRGKGDTSDASAEYVAYVRAVLDKKKVVWQTSELGKVDEGGGGTVAKYLANMNIETLDIGVPVISMHAPYETVAKVDVHSAYLAFRAFCEA